MLRILFGEHIDKKKVIKYGVLAGLAQILYCLFFIIFSMSFSKYVELPQSTIIAPFVYLLIFVFSVAISGLLVLGYPIYLALQKKYHESVATVIISLLTILVVIFITVIIFVI